MNPDYAGFWRRLLASLLDGLLFAAIMMPLGLLPGGIAVFLAGLPSWLLAALITLYCWTQLGGTPGKLLMGCQLLDAASGARLKPHQALLRYLAYILSALPLGLGFLWICWDQRKQGFHDRLAGTLVVREDDSRYTLLELQRQLR